MGSGVSVEIITHAKKLIDTAKDNTSTERTNALKQLCDLADNDNYRKSLASSESGLLQVLVSILKDDNSCDDTKKNASGIIFSLSYDNDVGLLLAKENGLMEVCVSTINSPCIMDIKFNLLAGIVNLLNGTGNTGKSKDAISILVSKELQLLPTLHDIIKSDKEHIQIRELSVFALASMACLITKENIQVMIDNKIHELVVDLLRPLDKKSTESWPNINSGNSYGRRCIVFLMNFSRHEQGALAVKAIGGDEVIQPLVTISSRNIDINIYAAFALAFVTGREEFKKATGKEALLVSVPKTLDYLIDVFKNTLDCKEGPGYVFGIFKLPTIVGAIAILAVSDANKKLLVTSPVLEYLIKVLERFRNNEGELTGEQTKGSGWINKCGGGGGDTETASLAVEALTQLSFYYDNDEDLRAKYLDPKYSMTNLIDALIEAPPSPLGPKDKENLLVLRNRLVAVTASSSVTDDVSDSQSSISDVHVMMSYAWEANKPLVEAITEILKKNGIDVWRDQEGSSKLGKMSGDTMEMMANAVKISSAYIICLSDAYRTRPNCRSEAQMIRKKQMKGRKIIFLMMEESFIDEVEDCWLALMVGAELWYPLWEPSQISSTAEEIIKLINGQQPNITTSIKFTNTPMSSPSKKDSNNNSPISPTKQNKEADYELAWALMHPKNISLSSSTFTELLEHFGIEKAHDLSQLDTDVLAFLPHLCKSASKKRLMDALGFS